MSQYHPEKELEQCRACRFYYLEDIEGEQGLCDACRERLKEKRERDEADTGLEGSS